MPLYGRGSTKQEDPRDKVPPRPAGQRTEPEPGSNFPGKTDCFADFFFTLAPQQVLVLATTVFTCLLV